MIRTIAVVTGSRAEFGLLTPVLRAIAAHPDLKLELLVTGMHLSEQHGRTVDEIRRQGFAIAAEIPVAVGAPMGGASRGAELGAMISGIARYLMRHRPDVVLVLGDRIEAFAGACAALAENVLLAQIHGGDRSGGGQDEAMRHAITKLAQLHFAASQESAERIVRLGEDPARVFVVGAPGVDVILAMPRTDSQTVRRQFGLPAEGPLFVAVLHPVSTHPETAESEMTALLDSLEAIAVPTVLSYPNDDPGGSAMIAVLEGRPKPAWLRTVKNLPHADYLSLLASATGLVGNSSSGCLEAPYFKVPVVEIGDRQHGRQRGHGLLLPVAANRAEITAALRQLLASAAAGTSAPNLPQPFGDGQAAVRIADLLASRSLGHIPRQKTMRY